MLRTAAIALALAATALLTGCLERKLSVTSDPPGAAVYANDVELGRTPLQASFTYYGTYDVRVEKDGYEPQRLKVEASASLDEYPPFDLAATALPFTIEHTIPWHFKLEPLLESRQTQQDLEKGMLDRANELRKQVK